MRDTKEIIREKALALFSERGIDGVSVRDIAAAVGMSPPNLYAHYKSKDALVGDLFHAGYSDYGRRLAELAAGPGTPGRRLAAMVREICRLHDEDTALFQFLLLNHHPALRGIAADSPLNPIEIVHRFLAENVPLGNAAVLAAAVVGAVVQSATFHHYGRLSASLSASADDLVALCGRVTGLVME